MKAFSWPNRGTVSVQFSQDWSEWFHGHYNWLGFCVIHLAYEDEVMVGNREITACLLGFHARVSWVYNDQAEMRQRIERRLNDFMNEVGAKSVAIHPAALADLLAKVAEGEKKKDDE